MPPHRESNKYEFLPENFYERKQKGREEEHVCFTYDYNCITQIQNLQIIRSLLVLLYF